MTKVVALAGTGKTTTLIRLCERNPSLKFLVVMFNKSAQEEAARRFPGNALCLTVHKMSKDVHNHSYSTKTCGDLKTKHIMSSDVLESAAATARKPRRKGGDSSDEVVTSMQRTAAQVVSTLNSFMHSADEELTEENVPAVWVVRSADGATTTLVNKAVVLEAAKSAWKLMIKADPENSCRAAGSKRRHREDEVIPLPLDGCLKL